ECHRVLIIMNGAHSVNCLVGNLSDGNNRTVQFDRGIVDKAYLCRNLRTIASGIARIDMPTAFDRSFAADCICIAAGLFGTILPFNYIINILSLAVKWY